MPGPDDATGPEGVSRADRSGRQRNGLTASAYASLVDLDPRLAGPVLQALARAGVAAYVEPLSGSVGGYLERRLPNRPTDRLWCDHRHRETARTLVEQELADWVRRLAAEPPVDPGWESVLASWRLSPEPAVPRWPDRPDGPDRQHHDQDDHEHYDPPPPPPLPAVQPPTRWALLAMVAGLVVLAAPMVVGVDGSSSATVLAVLAIVGGAASLVWRMRDGPDADDPGSDDGAVV